MIYCLFFGFFPYTAAGQRTCIHCLNSCSNKDGPVTCSANQPSSGSLGTPFCGSVIGRYRDASGNVRALAHRGCFNCAGKFTATDNFTANFTAEHTAGSFNVAVELQTFLFSST